MHKTFVLFVLLAIVCYQVHAGASAIWCRTPSGQACVPGAVATTTTATAEEEEEIVQEMTLDVEKDNSCESACTWVSKTNYVCDQCERPWAFYEKKNGWNGQCITKDLVFSIMSTDQQSADRYMSQCHTYGGCACRIDATRCTVPCSWFLPRRRVCDEFVATVQAATKDGHVCRNLPAIGGLSFTKDALGVQTCPTSSTYRNMLSAHRIDSIKKYCTQLNAEWY